ncbi:uncharacterized protein GIQ15_01259 [Arthroderma uncinatum]|uniref:uncharacterized protein n=1 Tax=Arthroderma uncinatum TaxID=74035 RepID=UPI00144A825F|nr:uncharacterized protein GIQ15_01259 [Arthroderma uncinatum]KAF3491742.1 hypothetical protein GIQ15_01259 [Arthroderma uncinatum]
MSAKRGTIPMGFQLVTTGALAGVGITSTCEQVLYQKINCDARILRACAQSPELAPGFPVVALLDKIHTGWNETCLNDRTSMKYCNDIIESWPTVEEISDMSRDQLCSYCYGAKLKLMQQSPYSAYDNLYAERLKFVIKSCNQPDSPTKPIENSRNTTLPEACHSDRKYVTQKGDTCDSISTAKGVSAATLYHINSGLRHCDSLDIGINLCLPQSCSSTYSVKPNDNCVDVAVKHGTGGWMKLVSWNPGLDSLCTNIVGANPSWGSVICVTPPGGAYGGVPPRNSTKRGNENAGGLGGSGDGYSDDIVAAPNGTIAEGTTDKCGNYVQVQDGDSCGKIVVRGAVPVDLFVDVNPSLESTASCMARLQPGVWYCLNPYRYWNMTRPVI